MTSKIAHVRIEITDERHPMMKLARVLRETAAVNFGKTAIEFVMPDGKVESYGVYPGRSLEEYEQYMAQLTHTGTKQ